MGVAIASAVLGRILDHAAAEPGREVCGLLLGEGDAIVAAVAVANVAGEPERRFELDPAAQFAALRAARVGGPRVIGHYHSHPNGRAEPSPRDAAGAHDRAALWMIVAGGVATLWRPDGRGGFGAIPLSPASEAVAQAAASRHKSAPETRPRAAPGHQGSPRPVSNASVDFASLLCSRLCHDLLSPVGALNNGLELLADENDPEMRGRVIELLGDSARASAAKLKFFRLAFGAAGGFGELVDTREAKAAIEGLLGEGKRIELGWLVSEPGLPKGSLKILLNLALIACDALVRGGRLDIGAEGTEIVVRAEGPRLVLDQELREALIGAVDEATLTPRAAAAYLAHRLAAEQGGSVQVSTQEDGVLLLGATVPRA